MTGYIDDYLSYHRLAREKMIKDDLIKRGITDERVIDALRHIPRELFVPVEMVKSAYDDSPLPIEDNQTISQPYIVAYMISCLNLKKSDRVLEIGAGSGYQSAIIAYLAGELYSMEISKILFLISTDRLARLGYDNIKVIHGSGLDGYKKKAPYEKIIFSATISERPLKVEAQLKEDGIIIFPFDTGYEELLRIGKKSDNKITYHDLIKVRFVKIRKSE